jgi:hypothetical protein
MNPKTPNADPSSQGSFFNEEVVHSGSTDPDQHSTEIRLDVAADGTYPELPKEEPKADTPAPDSSVHEAVVTANRHKGQLGKHSAMEETGRYSDNVVPGKFLPGFGPVRDSNLVAARQFAKELDDKRR